MIPQIKRILYATDLSDNSAFVLRYAIDFAKKYDAGIIILHVFEKTDPASKVMLDLCFYEKRSQEIFEKNTTETKAIILKRLKDIRENELKELKDKPEFSDMSISIEICEGFPAEEILSKAEELKCDVIIMGTHSKGFLANTFLGSTAKRVLRRTRKPVFIIPLPKGKTDITN